ncbi:MAG: XRE family transcriptional regulator [Bdellovibrionales bacterium]|nr:XRE family transcriptional regulator [Bdellovibrionales bacterium]
MAKIKTVRAHTVAEIAKTLGLTSAQGAEMAFRVNLNSQIIKIVKKKKITHAQLAKLAGSSRTRMTALLNRNISDVSTDLMLRVLSVLGYKPSLKIIKVA